MKKTALQRKTPLRRKTPIRNRRKVVNLMDVLAKSLEKADKRQKPAKTGKTGINPAKPGVRSAQARQREMLKLRSLGRCEAEVLKVNVKGCVIGDRYVTSKTLVEVDHVGTFPTEWSRCGAVAVFAAHIYQRRQCGPARDLFEVVIHTCVDHNQDHLTKNTKGVRAPLRFAQAAWDTILENSGLGERVHLGTVGPRPEKGVGLYA